MAPGGQNDDIMSSGRPRKGIRMLDTTTAPGLVLKQALERFPRRQLSAELGLDPRTIARWEAGASLARRDLLALLYLIARKPGTDIPHDFTFVDLFAGIGGMRLGLEAVKGRCVFTSEWDAQCQR